MLASGTVFNNGHRSCGAAEGSLTELWGHDGTKHGGQKRQVVAAAAHKRSCGAHYAQVARDCRTRPPHGASADAAAAVG